MRIGGHQPLPFIVEEVILRRPDNVCIVFKFKTVTDFKDFKALVPEPEPKTKHYPDGRQEPYLDDDEYKKKLNEYGMLNVHWLFLTSIQATENIEWDTVDMIRPETWGGYIDELHQWVTKSEAVALMQACQRANLLSDDMMKAARDDFLAGRIKELQPTATCQRGEVTSTLFGEPVLGLESVPQA